MTQNFPPLPFAAPDSSPLSFPPSSPLAHSVDLLTSCWSRLLNTACPRRCARLAPCASMVRSSPACAVHCTQAACFLPTCATLSVLISAADVVLFTGVGCEKDEKEAARLYLESAMTGFVGGMYNLVSCRPTLFPLTTHSKTISLSRGSGCSLPGCT